MLTSEPNRNSLNFILLQAKQNSWNSLMLAIYNTSQCKQSIIYQCLLSANSTSIIVHLKFELKYGSSYYGTSCCLALFSQKLNSTSGLLKCGYKTKGLFVVQFVYASLLVKHENCCLLRIEVYSGCFPFSSTP